MRSTLEVGGGFRLRSQKGCSGSGGCRAKLREELGDQKLRKINEHRLFFNVFAKLAQHGFKRAQVGLKLYSSWLQTASS